ncbi:ras guanine nucleotide exchange factor K-like [Zingiber officinale]|uniref:ras guanine nucleotide exchange factor K-like n=1 Tax=Zingiber officinale TaxID=94328 RepID=UPI001C4BD632|nr:ras guanine nucleotide exchange factor K-like [Zingiber officinale]
MWLLLNPRGEETAGAILVQNREDPGSRSRRQCADRSEQKRRIKQQNQENDEQPTSANYGIEDHLFDSENESAVLPSPIPWISRSGSKGNKVEQVAGIKGSSIIPSTPASPTLPSPRHLSPSPSFSSDTSKPNIIYKRKASPPPPPPPSPPPDYLKHEHGNHATARRLKEELKNSSRRECRDATNDITSPRNEQADNCGEDVAEASGGATEETSNHEAGGGEANEVDKKADEFIARFREQIRLQRIESIKRSTKQRSNKKQQVV